MRVALFVSAVFVLIASTGCGDVPRSRIHGTVKFQGKPLSNATIIFIASDNKTQLADLKSDGSFNVSGVAQGLVKVSIQQAVPKSVPRPDPTVNRASKTGIGEGKDTVAHPAPVTKDHRDEKDNGPRLPAMYTDPEKSGLAFELKEQDQEWSVDLK